MKLSVAINKKQIEKIILVEDKPWKSGDGLEYIEFYPKGSVIKSYFWGLFKTIAKEDRYYLKSNIPGYPIQLLDLEEYLKENSEKVYLNKEGQLIEKSFVKIFYSSGKVQKIQHEKVKHLYEKIINPNTVEDFIEEF